MAMLPNPLPKLAVDPSGSSLGLRLPDGTLVDATSGGTPWHEPLLWVAEEEAEAAQWGELLVARAAGLHPVLVEMDGGGPAAWGLDPGMMSYPGDYDADEVLAEFWGELEEGGPEEGGTGEAAQDGHEWGGLAPEGDFEADPDERAAEVAGDLVHVGLLEDARVALVHARRSADIPAVIGWCGPVNHENDVARLCAVLRDWEDRFGIRVVALTLDTLSVSVAAPPQTLEEAEAIAAEHYAFCPDTITQGGHTSLSAYAEKAVLGRHVWHFWWD